MGIRGWLFLIWVLAVLILIADFLGIRELVRIAKAKGHYRDGAGILWFIGLCGTLFMLGFVVASLPDWSDRTSGDAAIGKAISARDDYDALPEV